MMSNVAFDSPALWFYITDVASHLANTGCKILCFYVKMYKRMGITTITSFKTFIRGGIFWFNVNNVLQLC